MAVSAALCAASASIAADPVKIPATSFITPMPKLAAMATRTVSVLSPSPSFSALFPASFSSTTAKG